MGEEITKGKRKMVRKESFCGRRQDENLTLMNSYCLANYVFFFSFYFVNAIFK